MRKALLKMAAGLALLASLSRPASAGEPRTVPGHVPAAVARFNLQPIGRLPAAQSMEVVINLPPRNQELLHQMFRQIYDPASTNYHRYLTPEQYTEQFGPTPADYQAVLHFAETNGLTVVGTRASRSLVEVKATVAGFEQAFHIKLQQYRHPTEARTFFAPDTEPTVDRDIPIQVISGLNNYVIPHPLGMGKPIAFHLTSPSANGGGGGSDGGLFVGQDFRNAYAPGTALTGSGEVVGLFEYGGYNLTDIQKYESIAGYPATPLYNVLLNDLTVNQFNSAGNDVEISGDIEMVLAMAPGLKDINVYEGDYSVDASGNTIFDEMAQPEHGESLPHTLSCSWGFNADSASSNNFVRFALQGQSFFLALGDGGAFPTETGNASSNEHAEPDITQVGGTDLNLTNGARSLEVVWNQPSEGGQFATAGGYDTSVPIPDYQQGIDMSKNRGSTLYRNGPDVAMVADDILVVLTVISTNNVASTNASWYSWGTSFASPLWAGFAALANQQATAQGKPRLGFINPALYAIARGNSYASCFYDVTVGNNTWSNSPNLYYATNGFDLCTGWGSPTGTNLINALTAYYAGPTFVDFNFTGTVQDGDYDAPFNTLAKGVNAVSNNGTIFIKTAGTSPETLTLSKPMTIEAGNGTATIGN